MDLRGRTDQNRPVPPMPSRETAATVLGACGIAIPALLAAGGAAARPGGVWQGVPGWAPAAAILAAAVVLALAAHRRGSLAACAGLLLPVGLLLAGAPLAGVRALSGPPLLALALAGVAIAVAGSGLRPPPSPLPAARRSPSSSRRPGGRTRGSGRRETSRTTSWSPRAFSATGTSRSSATTPRAATPSSTTRRSRRTSGCGGRAGRSTRSTRSACRSLILPAWALAGYAGVTVFMALLAALVALEVREWVRELTGRDGLADAAGWAFALSPPLVHYAGLVFTEVPAALALSFGLRHARRAGPRSGRRRGRRPRGGRPAVAERPLRAARRPGGRARPVAAPAGARRSRGPRAGRRVRGGAAGLPPGALRLLGPAARLRAPPGARALDTRGGPSRAAARPGVRPARVRPRPRARAAGLRVSLAARSTPGDRGGRRRRGRAPDRGHVAHVAGRLQPARPVPGADRPPPRGRGGDGLGPAGAHRRRRAPPRLDAVDRPRRRLRPAARSPRSRRDGAPVPAALRGPGVDRPPAGVRAGRPRPAPARGRLGGGAPGRAAVARPGGDGGTGRGGGPRARPGRAGGGDGDPRAHRRSRRGPPRRPIGREAAGLERRARRCAPSGRRRRWAGDRSTSRTVRPTGPRSAAAFRCRRDGTG